MNKKVDIDHIDAKIIVILSENPGSYCLDICDIGDLSRSDIYIRLAKLEEAGLIRSEKDILIRTPDVHFRRFRDLPRRKYWAT